jgi:aldose 1-epimerase
MVKWRSNQIVSRIKGEETISKPKHIVMYQHRTTAFGPLVQHEFYNEQTGNQLSIVPGFGACVTRLKLSHADVMETHQDYTEMEINNWYKNLPLFPFPNRLDQGRYSWHGVDYQFKINDAITDCAIHGFGDYKPMQLVRTHLLPSSAHIDCQFDYTGGHDAYPFPFRLLLMFVLSDEDGFNIWVTVENTGDKAMPFGFGWHPYFRLNDDINSLALQLPALDLIGLDSRMMPTGKQYEYTEEGASFPIGSKVLDNCFYIKQEAGRATVKLSDDAQELEYWQECGPEQLNYLQLFTPPHRKSIAIEPMSCNINAFNSGAGLWEMERGEQRTVKFGVRYHKKAL